MERRPATPRRRNAPVISTRSHSPSPTMMTTTRLDEGNSLFFINIQQSPQLAPPRLFASICFNSSISADPERTPCEVRHQTRTTSRLGPPKETGARPWPARRRRNHLLRPADPEGARKALGLVGPHEDAPVFKVPIEEREMLVEVEPETFFFTPHYKDYPLVLVRPEKLDLDWAKANLTKVWRAQAPKRLLKAHDIAAEAKPKATSRAQRAKLPAKRAPLAALATSGCRSRARARCLRARGQTPRAGHHQSPRATRARASWRRRHAPAGACAQSSTGRPSCRRDRSHALS